MRSKLIAVLAVSSAVVLSISGCSNSTNSSTSTHESESSASSVSPTPVWVPKNEPNEDKDVTNPRVVNRASVDNETMMNATCTIHNPLSEAEHYNIYADVVARNGDTSNSKSVRFSQTVPAGQTVPCDDQEIGSSSGMFSYNLADWKVVLTKIDRFSVTDPNDTDDEQDALNAPVIKQRSVNDQSGIYVDYSVANNAAIQSSYTVKFILTDSDGKTVWSPRPFTTKALLPDEVQHVSVKVPNSNLQGKNFTVNPDGTIYGLNATISDVDRNLYVEKGGPMD